MSTWAIGVQTHRALRLSRVCWALAAVFALLSLAVLLFAPEVSVLSQPDGTKYIFIDRQVDLPTGDPAEFWDYSLLPLCGTLAACSVFYTMSVFYIMSSGWLQGRQANEPLQATAAPPSN
jgi:hypothetical protein